MGKERDKLIRSLGGVPLSEQNLSDKEILRLYYKSYSDQGRLPPELEAVRCRVEQEDGRKTR